MQKCECGRNFWTGETTCIFCRIKSGRAQVVDVNTPTSTHDASKGSRPVARSKYDSRSINGAINFFLGLFLIVVFNSAIDKAGTDPSAGLIVLISAPLIVLGVILIVIGIVMLLLGLGSDDSASMEQKTETQDSTIENPKKGAEPDHRAVNHSARDFVKQTASMVAGAVVAWVVIVPLVLFLTFVVFGQPLIESFLR